MSSNTSDDSSSSSESESESETFVEMNAKATMDLLLTPRRARMQPNPRGFITPKVLFDNRLETMTERDSVQERQATTTANQTFTSFGSMFCGWHDTRTNNMNIMMVYSIWSRVAVAEIDDGILNLKILGNGKVVAINRSHREARQALSRYLIFTAVEGPDGDYNSWGSLREFPFTELDKAVIVIPSLQTMCINANPGRLLPHWQIVYSTGSGASFFKTSKTKALSHGIWSDEWVLEKLKRDADGKPKMCPCKLAKVCGGLHYKIALALRYLNPDFEMPVSALLHLTDEQKKELVDRSYTVQNQPLDNLFQHPGR